MKINFGLMAIATDCTIPHFCGYENRPTNLDIICLGKELQED